MTRMCDLDISKKVSVGNNVSHSNRKTKRRFLPNLHQSSMYSDALGENVKLRLAVSTIRSIEKNHGLDNYLLAKSDAKLTKGGQSLRKKIELAVKKKKMVTEDKNQNKSETITTE